MTKYPLKPQSAESLNPLQVLSKVFYLFQVLRKVSHHYFILGTDTYWISILIYILSLLPLGFSQHPVSFCGRIRVQSAPRQTSLLPEHNWSRVVAYHISR